MKKEIVTGMLKYELHKDLQDDEIICPHCHGTGLEIAENIYGLQDDKTYIGVRFPYKKQAFKPCRYCYNGVLKKCKYCGSILTSQHYRCCCKESEQEERNKIEAARQKTYDNSTHISWEDACQQYACFYCDNLDVYFYDLGELINDLIDAYEFDETNIAQMQEILSILHCYICEPVTIRTPNAYDVINDVIEDCVELEPEQKDVDDLQNLLTNFFNERKIGHNYYMPNYKISIKFTEDNFKDE